MPQLPFRRAVGDIRWLLLIGVGAVALFLGLFFSAQAGLLALAAAWTVVAVWRYPWPAFLTLVGTAPFLLILKATIILGPLTVLKDVVIGTLLACVAVSHEGGRPRRTVAVPVLFLLGWSLVAFARSDSFSLGLLRVRDILLYVPLFVIAARLLSSRERLRAFLSVFLGSAVIVLFLGLVQWLWFSDGMVLRFDPARSVWIPRLASVLAHPNILGSYLLFVVPLGCALAFAGRSVHGRVRSTAGMLALAGLVAVYATYSRSAWIAHAVALCALVLLVVFLRYRRFAGPALALVLLLAVSVLALPRARSLLRTVTDPLYASNQERISFFLGTLGQISVTGAVGGEGLGDTVSLLGRQGDITLYEIFAVGARAVQIAKARTFLDNAVAKVWIEQGIIGLVLTGWVAARVFASAVNAARLGPTEEHRVIGVSTAATLIGLLPLWFLLDVPDIFPVNLLFWTFAGIVAAVPAAPQRK